MMMTYLLQQSKADKRGACRNRKQHLPSGSGDKENPEARKCFAEYSYPQIRSAGEIYHKRP